MADDARLPYARIVKRLAAPIVLLLLMAADCGAWVDWRLDVEGTNGRVRAYYAPFGTTRNEGTLFDLPVSFRGSDLGSVPRIPLAAVPDCGYAFTAWTYPDRGSVEPNPTIQARPGNDLVDPRDPTSPSLEVAFAPTSAPRNDCFATPTELTLEGASGSLDFENRTAGLEPGEPAEVGSYASAGASLWWTFEAPASGTLGLWVESDFTSILAVYEGSSLSDLDAIAQCVASACDVLEVPVAVGARLRIVVDGVASEPLDPRDQAVAVGQTGVGVLHWRLLPAAGTGMVTEGALLDRRE